jgi:hypothetical protein
MLLLNKTDVPPAIDKILTIAANAEPARVVAQSMETKKSKAYLFRFTRRPNLPVWPDHHRHSDLNMELSEPISINTNQYKPESDFISQISQYRSR